MKIIKMSSFFTQIRREKGKIMIFHVIFLNNDISITVLDIVLKLCKLVLHIHPEGSVSQIFYLGPSFYFI